MEKITIRRRFSDETIYTSTTAASLKEAVQEAVIKGIELEGADLEKAGNGWLADIQGVLNALVAV
ncbi:MAG: hypothetical protein RBQ99_01710 [Trichlorobacter sp.]|nr:hypothetical protein [Trichlorobacter sp.]